MEKVNCVLENLQTQISVLDKKFDLLFKWIMLKYGEDVNSIDDDSSISTFALLLADKDDPSKTQASLKPSQGKSSSSCCNISSEEAKSMKSSNPKTLSFSETSKSHIDKAKEIPSREVKSTRRITKRKRKPYACDTCGKNFAWKFTLKSHKNIHTDRFKCEICKKCFSKKEHLERHHRIHTGEKPYSCIFCHQNFRHLPTLKTHLFNHTGENPFECSICGLHFRQKRSLINHMKRKTCHTPENKKLHFRSIMNQ